MSRRTPKRSFGTELSTNSPLPPRYTPKKSAANKFVDDSVSSAVKRATQDRKSPKSAIAIEAPSEEEQTTKRGNLLAFTESPVESFEIYTGTPKSEASLVVSPTATSPSPGEKHWSKRAVATGAQGETFLYSTLGVTSPSFAKQEKKSWAQAVVGASPESLISAYPSQQFCKPNASPSNSDIASPGSDWNHCPGNTSFKSPDSNAPVVPTPISKRPYYNLHHIASPTGSIISTATNHTTASNQTSASNLFTHQPISIQDVASSMGPLEYAVQFPPGPLPFELEGVIHSGSTSMGCCVAKSNTDDIDISTYPSISSCQEVVSIHQNDLLISINSISILSRPHDTILSLIKKFESYEKILVFRSLDKVWKSQFHPSLRRQFKTQTVRNVRSGKRVNTAMDVDRMERQLWSWVETPTKADVGVAEARKRKIQRKERSKEGGRLSILIETSDSTDEDKEVNTPWSIFSPSNVKKLQKTPLRMTPSPLGVKGAHDASTAKKKNIKKIETPGKKKLRQISQVLVGEDQNEGFERILRLKKEVLKELHYVRLALMEQNKIMDDQCGNVIDDKIVQDEKLPTASRETLLNEAKQLKHRLESEDQFIEHFVDMQMMLRDEVTKSASLHKEVQRLSEETTIVKELQQKLYSAYEAMKRTEEEHVNNLAEKDNECSKIQSTLDEILADKDGVCSTTQSKFEKENAELKDKLRHASDQLSQNEKKSVIMQTDLEEEKNKAYTIESMLKESQRYKNQQEKVICSLEEEADRKQKIIEELEASSDLKSEELHRLRMKIDDLESKNKTLTNSTKCLNPDSAQKSAKKEEILSKMVEQEPLYCEVRESPLEEKLLSLEQERAVFVEELSILKTQTSDLKLERDDALHQLAEAKSYVCEKETEYNQSVSKVEHDKGLRKLQEKIQSQSSEIAIKDALIQELSNEVQDLTKSIQEQCTVKTNLADKLSQHFAASHNELVKFDRFSNALESKMEDIYERICKSESDCRAVVETSRSNVKSLSRDLAEKDLSLQRVTSDLVELENKVVQVAAELENSLIREQSARAELVSKGEALDELFALKAELDTKFVSMQSQLDVKDAELRETKEALTSLKELDSTLQQKNDEIVSIKAHLALAIASNSELKESYTNMQQKYSASETKHSDISKKLESTLKLLQDKEDKLTCVITQLDETRANAADLASQVQIVKEENNTLEESCRLREDDLVSNMTEKENQVRDLQAETLQLRIERDSLEAKIITANNNMQAIRSEHQNEKQSLASQIDKIQRETSVSVSRLKANLETAEQLLDQGDKDIHRLTSECEHLESQVKEMTSKLEHNQVELSSRITERDNLESRLQIQIQELRHTTDTLTNELESSRDIISKLEMEKTDLSNVVESTKLSLADANSLHNDLCSSLNELRATANTKETQIAQLESKNEALNKTVQELSSQVNQSKHDIETLEMVKNEHTEEISLLKSTKKMLSDQTSHLQLQSKKNDDLFKLEKQELMQSLEIKTSEIKSLMTEKEDLRSTVEMLQSVSRLSESRVATLVAEKEKLIVVVDNLTTQIDMLQQDSSTQTAENQSQRVEAEKLVDTKQNEVPMLNTIIDDLSREIERLKLEYGAKEDALRRQLFQSLEAREHDATESTSVQLKLENIIEEQTDTIRSKDKDLLKSTAIQVDLETIIDKLNSRVTEIQGALASDKQLLKNRGLSLLESMKTKEGNVCALTSKQDESGDDLGKISQQSQVKKEQNIQSIGEEEAFNVSNQISQNSELESLVRDLRSNVESLSKVNSDKDVEIGDLTRRQVDLRILLETVEAQLKDERSRVETQDLLISDLSASKVSLEAALKQMQSEIDDKTEDFKEKNESLESRLSAMQSWEQDFKFVVKDLEQTIFHLTSESFESSPLRDTTNRQTSIAAEKIKYQNIMDNLETARSSLQLKTFELEELMNDREAVVKEARHKETELKAIIDELKQCVDTEKASNTDLCSRIKTLTSSLEIKDREIEALKATNILFQDSLTSELIEPCRTVENKHNLEEETGSILSDYKDTVHELSKVKSELQSCQGELNDEKISHQNTQTNKDKLRFELQEAMKWCDSLRIETNTKSQKEKELRVKLQEAISWSDSLREEIRKQKSMLEERDNEITSLIADIKSSESSSQATISELDKKYQVSIKHIQKDAEREIDIARCGLQVCKEDLANAENAHKADLTKMYELSANLEAANDLNNSLRSDLREKQKLLQEKEYAIETLSTEIESMRTSSIATAAELTTRYNASIECNHNDITDLRLSLKESSDQIGSLKSEMEAKEMLLREKEDKIKSLKCELETVRFSSQEAMERSRNHFLTTIASKENELVVLNQRIQTLRSEVNEHESNLQQETSQLESTIKELEVCEENLAQERDCNRQASEKIRELISIVDEKDRTAATLRSMLHLAKLDVCQLSMEVSCTKGAIVLCIADAKKGFDSVISDLIKYYKAKEMNYKSIINELNEVITEQKTRLSNQGDAFNKDADLEPSDLSIKLLELSMQLEKKDALLNQQQQTVIRLNTDLSIARDELTSVRAEVSSSREIEASYRAEKIMLHHAISSILNRSSTEIDDTISSPMYPYQQFINFVQHGLRELCILHNVDVSESDSISSKTEQISAMLHSMKVSLVIAPIDIDHNQISNNTINVPSDIDETDNLIDMNKELQCASQSRQDLKRLLAMEQRRALTLEQAVSETNAQLDSKSKLLVHTQDQNKKLQTKYNRIATEIEGCQNLAVELKKIIIEKNAEIQTKENRLFELQYKLDDITARSDGLMASFDGIEDIHMNILSTSYEVAEVNKSVTRHDELAEEVTRLEEKILQMNSDTSRLSSMHQDLVDGLEAECQKLTDEIDEARDYICSLEDTQSMLEEEVDSLKKDCGAKTRTNMDLESALNILKEQKAHMEEDNRIITSDVSTLTVAVISYAKLWREFPIDLNFPSSCHENLQCIGRFIHFLHTTRQRTVEVDAITPKARGKGGYTEPSDICTSFKEIQDTFQNILASPSLTPVKHHKDNRTDQEDLYYDLVNAVGQLERLSENFRDCQEKWNDKETEFTLRIHNLENQSHLQISNLKVEQAWRQRLTTTMIENLHRRRQYGILRRAFRTWVYQARARKHLNIVKDMTKELLQTRQKVLLLKSHFSVRI